MECVNNPMHSNHIHSDRKSAARSSFCFFLPVMSCVDMTFAVKSAEPLIDLHGDSPVKDRRCAAPGAVGSTVDHADIRGLATALLNSVCGGCPHSSVPFYS